MEAKDKNQEFTKLKKLTGIEAGSNETIIAICNGGGWGCGKTAREAVTLARFGNSAFASRPLQYRIFRCDDNATVDPFGTLYAETKLERVGMWKGK